MKHRFVRILLSVMLMKTGKEILSSVLNTVQMGQVEIRSVLATSMRPALRKALENQLQEYHIIETEAYAIASQRGWDLSELEPAKRFIMDKTTRIKLNRRNTDSKIADMIIQGNTKALITGLKNLHQFPEQDNQISILSQRLLDCETANIRHMQGFL